MRYWLRWVVPRLGERTAELIEAPLMLAVTIVAARWVVRRLAVPAVVPQRLGMGLTGLGLLLVAELVVVLLVRGLTVGQYIAPVTRCPARHISRCSQSSRSCLCSCVGGDQGTVAVVLGCDYRGLCFAVLYEAWLAQTPRRGHMPARMRSRDRAFSANPKSRARACAYWCDR